MPELDYTAESHRLDSLSQQTIGAEATQRKIAVASARYQLDQAVSLALLADSIEALVKHVVGHVPPAVGTEADEQDTSPEQVWTLATEAEVGDRVVQRMEDGSPNPAVREGLLVAQVGASEGDVWIRLEGSGAKLWGKDFVIVEGVEDADEELADRIEAESGEDLAIDDDFAAPERPVDGFAALRAGKGKGKKGGK